MRAPRGLTLAVANDAAPPKHSHRELERPRSQVLVCDPSHQFDIEREFLGPLSPNQLKNMLDLASNVSELLTWNSFSTKILDHVFPLIKCQQVTAGAPVAGFDPSYFLRFKLAVIEKASQNEVRLSRAGLRV